MLLNVLNNVSLQLTQSFTFQLTNWFVITNYVAEGADKVDILIGFVNFVSPVSLTLTTVDGMHEMVLGGGYVNKTRRAYGALVSDGNEIDYGPAVVTWFTRKHFMVFKCHSTFGNVSAHSFRSNYLAHMLNSGGVNIAFSTVDKHMIEFVKQSGSKMLGVKVNDATHDVHILENNQRIMFNKFVDIFPTFNNLHGFDVINKLTRPWVEILIFVELELSKPRRNHTASTLGLFHKTLQPLDTSDTQLKVHRKNTTFLQHLMVGYASVFAVLVNFMSFS